MRLCEVWKQFDVKLSHCLPQGQPTARLTDGDQQQEKTQIVFESKTIPISCSSAVVYFVKACVLFL